MPGFLQRLFAPIAIPGLLRIVGGFQALVFILLWIQGEGPAEVYKDKLSLDFEMVLRGEFWRLLSFVALPPADPFTTLGLLVMVFAVFFLFFINDILEAHWGVAGTNAFVYLGVLASIAGSVVAWLLLGSTQGELAFLYTGMLGASLLFAAGTLEPRLEIRFFLFIPMPLALAAAITGGLLILSLLFSPVLLLVGLVSQAHYLVFALPRVFRNAAQAAETRTRRGRFEAAKAVQASFHHCEKCGATEGTHPEREFRVTADGHELCDACRPQPPAAPPS